MTMSASTTSVPLSEAKARLSELAKRVRTQHERVTLTRNGREEVVLVSVDDLDGLEMTLEILADSDAVARIADSLTELEQGEPGLDVDAMRRELSRRRTTQP
jgi:antitoxin YefM